MGGRARKLLLLGRAPVSYIDPLSLLWDCYLDADDAASVYQDDGLTTLATDDGHSVGGIKDIGGNTNHHIQATAGKQPLLKTGANGINGRRVLRFDGTDDLLRCGTNFLNTSEGTVFAVYRLTASPSDSQTLLCSNDEAATTTYWALQARRSGAVPNVASQQRNLADTDDIVRGDTTILASTVYIVFFESTGTAYAQEVNGVAQSLTVVGGADNGDWLSDTSGRDSFVVGALKRTTETEHLKGDLAALGIRGTKLSATEKTNLRLYAAYRWGVSL